MARLMILICLCLFFASDALNNLGSSSASNPQVWEEWCRVLGFAVCAVGLALSIALLGPFAAKHKRIWLILPFLVIGSGILSYRSAWVQMSTVSAKSDNRLALITERDQLNNKLYPPDSKTQSCRNDRFCNSEKAKTRVAEINSQLQNPVVDPTKNMPHGELLTQLITLVIALGPALGSFAMSLSLGLLPPRPNKKKAKQDQPFSEEKIKKRSNVVRFPKLKSGLSGLASGLKNGPSDGLKMAQKWPIRWPHNPLTTLLGQRPHGGHAETGEATRIKNARKLIEKGAKPSTNGLQAAKLGGSRQQIQKALLALADEGFLNKKKNGKGYDLAIKSSQEVA